MGIRRFTNLDNDYYNNDQNHGNYQYTTIKDIVNNFMFSQTDDSYVANVNRNNVSYHAKRAVQELYYDVVNEIIRIEFDLNPTLIIPLPHDYVSYVRISWVDDRGKLHPLSVNNSCNLAQAYLQDHDFEYLYNDEGDILQGNHLQETEPTGGIPDDNYHDPGYYGADGIGTPCFNANLSQNFRNGSYIIDRDRGIIQFSSAVQGRTISIEYISDGLFQRTDAEIRINKFAEQAVYDFIYFNLVKTHRNVPEREKFRAERTWYNSRRVAKRRIQPVRYEEFRQIMRGQSKFIKD